MAWRQPFSKRPSGDRNATRGQGERASTAAGQYISERGGNNAPPTYQDASGAPVESQSPLGYSVGPVTITLLNITMMIGAGIYSTRSCDTNIPFADMSTNMTQHHQSCLEQAQSVSV
jgi:hypothetical protein